MKDTRERTPVARVQPTDTAEGLVVCPGRVADIYTVRAAVRAAAPGAPTRSCPEGLWVAGEAADSLLGPTPGVELRWAPEARRFAENRRQARRVHPGLWEEVARIRQGGRALAEDYLAGVDGLDVLDDHQWVNVAAMTLPDGFGLCVFDEQGAGKTVTYIFAFDVLVGRNKADFTLIVAPKSMVAEWPRDFDRFKSGLYKVQVVTGTAREKRAAITSGADVLVTNYETVISMEDELRAMFRRDPERAVLAVDESFYAKNLEARRTRALRRLREWCGRAFVLCGTPAPNSPHDLIQQFNIVDFGLTFAGVELPDDRESATPVVQEAIEERGLFVRHLKADVLPDLPPKQFHRVLVPLQPDQQRLYQGALRDLILDLRATDDQTFQRELASFFARRSALLQICSNPASVAPGYAETPAKLLALDGLLEEAVVRRGEKIVLWSFYTASIDAIMGRFDQYGPVRYDGTVADIADRREAVRRFQEDDSTMLFVGNPAAAGAGLTLHRARLAVYESMSNQAAHYLQSLDRIHRRGQTRDVEYLVLLCDKTIELEEYDRLTEKERSAQQLLGDRVDPPITRQAMLRQAEDAARLLGMRQV
jgi:SNF2 family DNA or RNA helicase